METRMMTVIIPMYNESGVIRETANTLSEYMAENFSNYEIIFFDDGSKDDCADVVKSMQLPCVRVLSYGENKGKGCAVRHAMLEANGDVVMFTDADLAYGTDVIKRVYDIMCQDGEVNVLIGSRNLAKDGYEGYTKLRRLMSKVYIKVLGFVGGFKLSDSQCGCKAFRRNCAKEIFSRCEVNGFSFDFEAILWAQKLGFMIKEMPVKVINHRESKINLIKDSVKMMNDVRKIRKRVKNQAKQLKEK